MCIHTDKKKGKKLTKYSEWIIKHKAVDQLIRRLNYWSFFNNFAKMFWKASPINLPTRIILLEVHYFFHHFFDLIVVYFSSHYLHYLHWRISSLFKYSQKCLKYLFLILVSSVFKCLSEFLREQQQQQQNEQNKRKQPVGFCSPACLHYQYGPSCRK